jgi:hypothetical protein
MARKPRDLLYGLDDRPPPSVATGDEAALLAFSGGLIRKLATGVKVSAQNGECRVQIHFQR